MSKNVENIEIPEVQEMNEMVSAIVSTDGEIIIGVPLEGKNPDELRTEIPVIGDGLVRLCGVSKSTPEQMATVEMAIKHDISEIPATVAVEKKESKEEDIDRG